MKRLQFSYLTPQRMVYVTQITICGCDLELRPIISIFCIIIIVLHVGYATISNTAYHTKLLQAKNLVFVR